MNKNIVLRSDDWDDGNGPETTTPPVRTTVSAPVPASPLTAPPKTDNWTFPPNASRDDCLRIKASAESVLSKNPDHAPAKAAFAEANRRLIFFTPSGLRVPKTIEQVKREAADAESKASNATLPNDLSAAFKSVRDARRLPSRNPQERAFKRAMLKRVQAHAFQLQQGLPTVLTNGPVFPDRKNSSALRKQRLERLKDTTA